MTNYFYRFLNRKDRVFALEIFGFAGEGACGPQSGSKSKTILRMAVRNKKAALAGRLFVSQLSD
jgi:hypothetical protein